MALAKTLPSSTPIWSDLLSATDRSSDTLLTEGVDSPNDTLDEDFVLVKSDQGPYHAPISALRMEMQTRTGIPRVAGVKRGKMMLLLGLLPSKTLLLIKGSLAFGPNSSLTCSSVFPNARASG